VSAAALKSLASFYRPTRRSRGCRRRNEDELAVISRLGPRRSGLLLVAILPFVLKYEDGSQRIPSASSSTCIEKKKKQ